MTSVFTEESFNNMLDQYNRLRRQYLAQEERAEMYKGAFYCMEGYRDFWRGAYKESQIELTKLIGKN